MKEIAAVENLCHIYQEGTPFQCRALDGVSFSIGQGEMAGIIGPTGSGKSTLIQHLNGLLRPSSGRVMISGRDINRDREKGLPPVCFQVGLVFQYPEYQLFEETVFEDIAFGPRNMDLPPADVESRVREAMGWMGLDFEMLRDRSPFSLSGGEMRRVALAGVLAMKPGVLVLDEPTAGLDPRGCRELMERVELFRRELGMTLIMVSHNLGDLAGMVDRLIVLKDGRLTADGPVRQVLAQSQWLRDMGLGVPPYVELMERLAAGGVRVRQDVLSAREAADEIAPLAGGRKIH